MNTIAPATPTLPTLPMVTAMTVQPSTTLAYIAPSNSGNAALFIPQDTTSLAVETTTAATGMFSTQSVAITNVWV